MKNADKPINPIKGADNIFYTEQDLSFIKQVKPFIGLSKKEYFSVLAMQGMLANPNGVMTESGMWCHSPEEFARLSIICADELLKQLEDD